MIPLTVTEVAQILDVPAPTAAPDVRITGAEIDSRKAGPGTLFVALPGEHADGHDFVAAALAAGAAAALVTRRVPEAVGPQIVVADAAEALGVLAREALARLRATGPIDVLGITGSVGKTSTKDLLSRLLLARGGVVAPVASFNNEIGLPLTVLRADADTRSLVLEMGADAPGNLTYLTSIAPPDVAVVLVVGRAHLQGFGDIDGVARAKAELVQGLAPGGVAVLNADDARVAAMATHAQRVRTFGTGAGADLHAEGLDADADGHARFDLVEGEHRVPVRLALTGVHHVTNALAAAAAARELGMTLEEIAAGLATIGPISAHRMHVRETAVGVRVVDDAYNANPESMTAALRALAAMTAGGRRGVAVVGEMREMGADAAAEHAAVGRLAATLGLDTLHTVAAGTLPAHEAALAEGGVRAVHSDDVDAALEALVADLAAGDVVLLKASNGSGLTVLADRLVDRLGGEGTQA